MSLFRLGVVLAAALLATAGSRVSGGQELDPARLLHPSTDSWPLYHGDYSGKRHSQLT